MLFKPRHIDAIRQGVKTATRRDWADGYARPNPGVHMATTEMFATDEACDCYIIVERVYRQPLGEMTEEDGRKEGGYGLADFREAWEQINGPGAWDPEMVVDVVEFTYGGRTREEAEEKARELGVTA
jgi:hypothetical protein